MTDTPFERLKQAVGSDNWVDQPADLASYLTEWRGNFQGTAELVLRPSSTAEVSEIVRICAETSIAVVPQGGNTGLCGGAVAERGSVIVSLSRLNKVRSVDVQTNTMVVEAGVVLAEVQRIAAEHDRLFPLSLAAEGSCQIGGALSTNAGGVGVLRYGNARELVLGVEVVLPDGQLFDGLTQLRKNNTGYDLRDLFIGAEGTLGIITAAVLKLHAVPKSRVTAMVALPSCAEVTRLLTALRRQVGEMISLFEGMNRLSLETVCRYLQGAQDPFADPAPWYALVELTSAADIDLAAQLETGLAEAFEQGMIADAVIAQNDTQAHNLRRLREEISDAQRPLGAAIRHDIAVPLSAVPEFIQQASAAVLKAEPGVRIFAFGHFGDGNIHFNVSQPADHDAARYLSRLDEISEMVHDIAHALGGSFSAEHGVGRLKLHDMERYKSPTELDLMRRIKNALDPAGIMNPGKILPPVAS
jgi:D-lactate dehydrogenase (cytochrome)